MIDSALEKLTARQAAPAILKRGHAYLMKGDWDKALQDYDEVVNLDPNQAYAYIGRAVVYSRKGESAKAFSELDALPGRQFKKPESAMNSLAWFRATCPDATLRDSEKAIEEFSDESVRLIGMETLELYRHTCGGVRRKKRF